MAVFVNGFDFDTDQDAIAGHFEAIGRVADIKLIGRGSAVVRFENAEAAEHAVQELNETTIPGNRRYITVKMDQEKGGKKGKKGGGKDRDEGGGKGGRWFDDRTTFDGEMQTGVVAKFLTDRGFGYITPDRGGSDIFVHFSAIQGSGFRDLQEGQRVRFGAEPDTKGKGKGSMRAAAVTIL